MTGDRDRKGRKVLGPFNAWVLSKTMADVELEGGMLKAMAPKWRAVAERMMELEPEARPVFLEGLASCQDDPMALVQEIVDARPLGPGPTYEEMREWDLSQGLGIESEAILCRASEVREERVEWLWPGRVPLGMLTLFSGDPKVGKSLTALWVIARLTRGEPMPGCDRATASGSAILLSAEDSPSLTLKPRLLAAGADLSRVGVCSGVRHRVEPKPGEPASGAAEVLERMLTINATDLALLERKAVEMRDCRLIVIDPVSSYLGDCNDHNNAELRAGVLAPLQRMAERLGAAIVLVTHHNKAAAAPTNGKHRVTGSIAYVAACRANFLFMRDPDDAQGRRALMLDNGGNLAARQPGLSYVIAEADERPYCDWQPGTIDLDADAALIKSAKAARGEKSGESGSSDNRRRCAEWLEAYLAGGTKPAAECEAAGQAAGFPTWALFRTRKDLGIRTFQRKRVHYWSADRQENDPDEPATTLFDLEPAPGASPPPTDARSDSSDCTDPGWSGTSCNLQSAI